VPGDVLVFSCGHLIRVFSALWLGFDPEATGRHFLLTAASLSAVGYDRKLSQLVIRLGTHDRRVVE
jgi:probable phosphoglycerate mutase